MEVKNEKEQTTNNVECSIMLKQSMLFILNVLKEQGINVTEKIIDFWEKQ